MIRKLAVLACLCLSGCISPIDATALPVPVDAQDAALCKAAGTYGAARSFHGGSFHGGSFHGGSFHGGFGIKHLLGR